MQILEESTGPPPLDASSIDEEGNWIDGQIKGMAPWINKKDIIRFLELHHVQKLDVSILPTRMTLFVSSNFISSIFVVSNLEFLSSSRFRLLLCIGRRSA